VPGLNALAIEPYDGRTTFSDRVHFLHVYVLEAHPQRPDVSPYSGDVWEVEGLSLIPQARTYDRRREFAAMTRELLAPGQIQVIDALDLEGLVNPVWCTYGTAPNSTYLIGRDGIIRFAANWTEPDHVEAALRELLAEEE
jgi:hypothetical protein